MYTITTLIQQAINVHFGRRTKIKRIIWIKASNYAVVYKVVLKDTAEERIVFIPYNGDKPWSINYIKGIDTFAY